jgi:hypothetical protein
MRLLVLAFAATTVLAARAHDSTADGPVTSPFGPDTPVQVIIGSMNGQQVVIWRNQLTQECATTVLGGASGLDRAYNIATSETNDGVWKPTDGWSTGHCGGIRGGPLNYNGHYLDVYMAGGNDQASIGPGDTYVLGESGNDDISSSDPNALLAGGEGDDSLDAGGSGFFQSLYGEGGNDCLSDRNSAASVFDCGAGWDRYTGNPSNAINCDEPLDFCR